MRCREGTEWLPERVGGDIEGDDPLGAECRGSAAAGLGSGQHPIDGLLKFRPEVAAVAPFTKRLRLRVKEQHRGHHLRQRLFAETGNRAQRLVDCRAARHKLEQPLLPSEQGRGVDAVGRRCAERRASVLKGGRPLCFR